MKIPHDYQEDGIRTTAQKIAAGVMKILFQLATGGGKTVVFSTISHRYLQRNDNNRVLIIVHREELLEQAYKTLYEWYGIIAEKYTAGCKKQPTGRVVIGMVETINNRLKKDKDFFTNYGVWIIDECHLGNHRKLYEYLKPTTILLGVTATPISAKKKHPLKDDYADIVCGIDIPPLIEKGKLLPNKTYSPVGKVDVSGISTSTGDYNTEEMGSAYSKGKHIANTLEQYKQKAFGKKTLIFNCNIAHSKLVNETFIAEGIPSKHLDGETPLEERRAILKWFKDTKDAVLQNVAVATTGFDEPSIFCVIINKDTLSLSSYLQMAGRGGRIFGDMDHFVLIDMGGNYERHGDWSDARDWEEIFWNPGKAKKPGLAPVTYCPQCEALIHISATICKWCGFEIVREMKIVNDLMEFKLVKDLSPANISVKAIKDENPGLEWHQEVHAIKNRLISIAVHRWKLAAMDDGIANELLSDMLVSVKQWTKLSSRPFNGWLKDYCKKILFTALTKEYGYQERSKEEVRNTEMQEGGGKEQESMLPLHA